MAMRRLNRRDFLRLSAAATAGAMIGACQSTATPAPSGKEATPDEGTPATPAEKVHIFYQDWADESYRQAWQEVEQIFTDAHPNIEVEYLGRPSEHLETLLAQLAAGIGPDIFETCCAHGRLFWEMGHLLVLDPYVETTVSEQDMKDVPVSGIRFWRAPSTGELYGWPKYQGNLAIFVNLETTSEEGITYPDRWDEAWTPDQYREVLKQLSKGESGQPGRVYGGGRYQWFDRDIPFLLSNGAHFVNPDDDTECLLGKPEAQEVFEFWRVLHWEDRSVPCSAEAGKEAHIRSQFVAGEIATIEEGSWALREVSELCPFPWDVAPLYHWPRGVHTLATSDGWHVRKETKSPDAAWELMLFLSGPAYGKALAKAHFLQPARLSLMDDYIGILREQASPLREVNLELFKEARERDLGHPMELCWNQSIAEEIMGPVFEQVFGLGKAGVDAIAEACDEVTERLRAEKARVG